jgi:3-oxoadipate enol-lactonase/4-carboxymuconolactone decarboxylase
MEQEPIGIAHACRAVFGRQSIVPRLGEIRAPALVLVGTEDISTPPSRSEEIAAGIPGAEMVLIPRAGHLAALEAPEAVTKELLGFLRRCR